MILKLAWRNIWRNKQRSFITMASVFFAVILSIVMNSIQIGVFDNLINNVVGYYSGHIQVHKSGYWNEQLLDNGFIYNKQLESEIIKNDKIRFFTPRLETFALASTDSNTKGVMVIGTDTEKENQLTGLKNRVVSGLYFSPDDRAVLVAEVLAERLKVKVNDTVIIIGQGYHGTSAAGKYPVKGIVKFASPVLNEKMIYLPLREAQFLFNADNILTSLAISIENPGDLNIVTMELKKEINGSYEVMSWEEMMPDIVQHLKSEEAEMVIISGILYLIIAFGIFGTILMMSNEREYEFGVLVSIGMKKLKLGLVVIIETINIAVAGALFGITASVPIVYYLAYNPIRFSGELAKIYQQFGFEPVIPASTSVSPFISQGATVFIIAVIISLYPLVKVYRLKPAEAIKK